jgi:hypothetical protein
MVENTPFWFWWRFLLKKLLESSNVGWQMFLWNVKISKLSEFPICGQPQEIVRNFRNSIPEINVFHLIFKQDFRNFRQMESAPKHEKTMYENTSAKRECFHTLFSSVWISR